MEKITVCTGVPEDGCAYCSFISGVPEAHYCRLFDESIYGFDKCEECKQAVKEAKNNNDPTRIYKAALDTWGAKSQTIMVFEEMSELQKELCKNLRGRDNRDAIAEEISDVRIMLEQMILLHNCGPQVQEWRKMKLERLANRLREAGADCCAESHACDNSRPIDKHRAISEMIRKSGATEETTYAPGTVREKILEAAKARVCGERDNSYGEPENNFALIAKLWSDNTGITISPIDVCMMMAMLKIARIRTGTDTLDSFVDLVGYAACGGEIAETFDRRKRRKQIYEQET